MQYVCTPDLFIAIFYKVVPAMRVFWCFAPSVRRCKTPKRARSPPKRARAVDKRATAISIWVSNSTITFSRLQSNLNGKKGHSKLKEFCFFVPLFQHLFRFYL